MVDQAGDFPRGVTRERIDEELARISAAPDFARAPVMRRLLEFLVTETLEGRGDSLKAYAVAVDGLGRPEDFDAQSDSYPRVQVGRLRRMLDTFYARDEAADSIRLQIPPGQYRVFFVPTTSPADQPTEAKPSSPRAGQPAMVDPSPSPAAAMADATAKLRLAAALLALTIVAIVVSAVYLARRDAETTTAALSVAPSLVIDRIAAPPSLEAIDIDVDAVLLDGLRRSWLVRVHDMTEPSPPTVDPKSPQPIYRLAGTIKDGAQPLLRLKLSRGDTGELIWTGQALLPSDRALLREALTPMIAEMIQPYGVIATDQRAAPGNRFSPGHRCILEFDRYRRDRTAKVHTQLTDCVNRTLAINPGDALALAAKSFLVIDTSLYRFSPSPLADLPQRSLALATRATVADPYNAFAQLALARASLYAATCGLTVRAARRSIALDPYDPDLAGIAGILLLNCEDPGAEILLKRAIALEPDSPPNIQISLMYALIDRGDLAGAQKILDALRPPPPAMRPTVELARAVMSAESGDYAKARRAWDALRKVDPQTAADPGTLFDRWMLSDNLRRNSYAALERAGVISGSPVPANGDTAR